MGAVSGPWLKVKAVLGIAWGRQVPVLPLLLTDNIQKSDFYS